MNSNGRLPRIGRPAVLAVCVAVGLAGTALGEAAPAAAATPSCATTVTQTTPTPPSSASPAPGPCWTDVTPYPFGSDGNPVDASTVQSGSPCSTTVGDTLSCYLTVTSMAFRAWNRGLAATVPTDNTTSSYPFGVWIFNGVRWFPDPTFPGSGVCKGTTILWAGKLDYWLIGPPAFGAPNWPSLCRFDGLNFEWEPLAIPQATLARAPQIPAPPSADDPPGTLVPSPGVISSGACYSYDNCWFFGSFGSVLHWNGTTLADASPDPSETWLDSPIFGAITRTDAGGNPFGVAVAASEPPSVVASQPDGSPPPQVYGSSGGAFAPLPFAPPTSSIPSDPYRTDLVAADFGSDRQGWLAGNPAGLAVSAATQQSLEFVRPIPRPGPPADLTAPAPLLTTTAAGAQSTCSQPPTDRFTYSDAASLADPTDAFLWDSISVIPGTDEALAGGELWPASTGPGPNQDGMGEPVIVDARCDGTTTTTRFTVADPTHAGGAPQPSAPADRTGAITALAANAVNDAWAATGPGLLDFATRPGDVPSFDDQRPHLYRLTDGQPPAAPAGDDVELRPLTLQLDPPPIAEPLPPAPPPPPPPAVVKQSSARDPLPSVYDVVSKLHGTTKLELYLTFKLRRPVTLGAQALRDGHVISTARLHHFTGHSGTIELPIDPHAYPTAVRFTSDAPRVTLANPGQRLSGTVKLRASATPYRGRRISSVSFEYSPTGKAAWTVIGTATAAPATIAFATATVTPGGYDLRAVATDNAGVSGLSAVLAKRSVVATSST